jgi:hypothetical protein
MNLTHMKVFFCFLLILFLTSCGAKFIPTQYPSNEIAEWKGEFTKNSATEYINSISDNRKTPPLNFCWGAIKIDNTIKHTDKNDFELNYDGDGKIVGKTMNSYFKGANANGLVWDYIDKEFVSSKQLQSSDTILSEYKVRYIEGGWNYEDFLYIKIHKRSDWDEYIEKNMMSQIVECGGDNHIILETNYHGLSNKHSSKEHNIHNVTLQFSINKSESNKLLAALTVLMPNAKIERMVLKK